eukprot:248070-Prorocentrum_minimum.AAC.1
MPLVFFTFSRVLRLYTRRLHLTVNSPLDPLWTPSGGQFQGRRHGVGAARAGGRCGGDEESCGARGGRGGRGRRLRPHHAGG